MNLNLKLCKYENDIDLNCVYQLYMLECGYVMLDGYEWKKKEACTEKQINEAWLTDSPDFQLVHTQCIEKRIIRHVNNFLKLGNHKM